MISLRSYKIALEYCTSGQAAYAPSQRMGLLGDDAHMARSFNLVEYCLLYVVGLYVICYMLCVICCVLCVVFCKRC